MLIQLRFQRKHRRNLWENNRLKIRQLIHRMEAHAIRYVLWFLKIKI